MCFQRALTISSDESDSVSESSITHENGNSSKKLKLQEKDNILSNDKEIKNDVPTKEKPTTVPVAEVAVKEINKETNKEGKMTTVKDMLRAKRDAAKTSSSHIRKGSKSASSATSDDSSSTDTDSSDSSSDADAEGEPNRDDDDDDVANSLNSKAPYNSTSDKANASSIVINKIQTNGTSLSNNIPQEIDTKFLDSLAANTRESISRFIDVTKHSKDNTFQPKILDLLYEYVHFELI